MNDMTYVPELSRPVGYANLREQVNDLSGELARERVARLQAEADARSMALFIRARVGAAVWGHDDVMAMLHRLSTRVIEEILTGLRDAQRRGIPPTYTMTGELVRKSFDRARAETLQRLGDQDEMASLHLPQFVTPRMKEDLRNTVRIPVTV